MSDKKLFMCVWTCRGIIGCEKSCKIGYLHSVFVYREKKRDAAYCINCALFSPTDSEEL